MRALEIEVYRTNRHSDCTNNEIVKLLEGMKNAIEVIRAHDDQLTQIYRDGQLDILERLILGFTDDEAMTNLIWAYVKN